MYLSIRYDDSIHHRLKIIAAYKGISLNKLMNQTFINTITEWETKNGIIKIPESKN